MKISDPSAVELEDWGLLELPLGEALDGPMATWGVEYYSSEDERSSTGIWECAPGRSRWELSDGEFITVVSGSMTCTPDGGEPVVLGAGDSYTYVPGWSGIWEIHEQLRKLYVMFPPAGA